MAMSHCAKKYELNIEAHECNEPHVSLPPSTATQPIGLYWTVLSDTTGV